MNISPLGGGTNPHPPLSDGALCIANWYVYMVDNSLERRRTIIGNLVKVYWPSPRSSLTACSSSTKTTFLTQSSRAFSRTLTMKRSSLLP